MDTIQNHPATKSVTDTVVNGPVGATISDQTTKTSNEFADLTKRTTPKEPAATGQPLTHYHSMFYRLLSWKNPRATAITFLLNILFIFAARYLDIIRYVFKGVYFVTGVMVALEIIGQTVIGDGIATRMRPRKYFVIPKESLERFLEDFEQFINFFVIEFQRILFVESIWATVGAFLASFTSYHLIKLLPLWGLSLMFTTTLYLAPLIYVKNQEMIDAHLSHAGNLVNQQAAQMKDLAAHHTERATETVRSYAGEYTQKAQEMMGQSRQKIPGINTNGSTHTTVSKPVKVADFPAAPKEDPIGHANEPHAVPEPQHAY